MLGPMKLSYLPTFGKTRVAGTLKFGRRTSPATAFASRVLPWFGSTQLARICCLLEARYPVWDQVLDGEPNRNSETINFGAA